MAKLRSLLLPLLLLTFGLLGGLRVQAQSPEGPPRAAAGAVPVEGQPLAAFDTVLLDGKTVLPARALRGKALLVMFWASWCPICQKELPGVQALYEKYRERGFEVLALSIDADEFAAEEFWLDHEYGFPVAMRARGHGEVFGRIKVVPSFFLIDRQGVLRHHRVGAAGQETLEAWLLPLL